MNNYEDERNQNDPNSSMMSTMYTSLFGSTSFQITPPSPGEVGAGFPSVPYLSIEAVLYENMSSNPMTAPFNTVSGSNTGQQVIGGQITQQDQNGTSRLQQGYQSTTG